MGIFIPAFLGNFKPVLTALGTLTAGVIQLTFKIPDNINKVLSVFLIFIGIVTIFITLFTERKKEYEDAGVKINQIYQDLRNLYFMVQGTAETDTGELNKHEAEYNRLIGIFNNTGITHQMMFSDWYAHYKFFVQLETDWIEEQRPFKFRDKVPLALRWTLYAIGVVVAVVILTAVVLFVQNTFF